MYMGMWEIGDCFQTEACYCKDCKFFDNEWCSYKAKFIDGKEWACERYERDKYKEED